MTWRCLDPAADLDAGRELRRVEVLGRVSVSVLHDEHATGGLRVARFDDLTVSDRPVRGAARGTVVDAVVLTTPLQDGVKAPAVARGDARDLKRRLQERLHACAAVFVEGANELLVGRLEVKAAHDLATVFVLRREHAAVADEPFFGAIGREAFLDDNLVVIALARLAIEVDVPREHIDEVVDQRDALTARDHRIVQRGGDIARQRLDVRLDLRPLLLDGERVVRVARRDDGRQPVALGDELKAVQAIELFFARLRFFFDERVAIACADGARIDRALERLDERLDLIAVRSMASEGERERLAALNLTAHREV